MQFLSKNNEDTLTEQVKRATDCGEVMTEYLLNTYSIYRYRTILSFIVAGLVTPQILKYFGLKDGGMYRTYIILFLAYYSAHWVITQFMRNFMLDPDELNRLYASCNGWQNDSKTKSACKSVVEPELAAKYLVPIATQSGSSGNGTLPNGPAAAGSSNNGTLPYSVPAAVAKQLQVKESMVASNNEFELIREDGTPSAANDDDTDAFANPMLTGCSVSKGKYAAWS